SPEFNLKILWAHLRQNIFEIAHSFRARESGNLHSSEFLMLEWYMEGDEEQTFSLILELIRRCQASIQPVENLQVQVMSVQDLFARNLHCGLGYEELKRECLDRGHFRLDSEERRYEEYFFTLFLNYLEPRFPSEEIFIVRDYPPELAAYAKIENGFGRRFEVYWKGLELANGYAELQDAAEQKRRMMEEASLKRQLTGKNTKLPGAFLSAMESPGLPEGCGVALGLDRLLMALTGADRLRDISPFPAIPDVLE
ncbi:MAG: elongation factor P--(R)-beta-lysine ligase, partial [Leptospiraceae bacterium]|nr:elongation factor P--(R)-beta-lysine ligase [Leptospiraceae bacterium]